MQLVKKFNNYYIQFNGGLHEETHCFLRISEQEAEEIINNPEKITEIRDSYKSKIEWTEKYFIDSFLRDYLTSVYGLSNNRVEANLEKLNRHEDIKLELYETVVYGDFPKNGIKVCGYNVETIKNMTDLSVLGAYNYLIFLREDEKEAIIMLVKGLPVK